MKKSLLVLAAGLTAVTSFGQSQSVVFTKNAAESNRGIATTNVDGPKHNNKTTATGSSWFDYSGLFIDPNGGAGATGYYFAHYQDSNVVGNGSTGTYNLNIYGFGNSFDPTDSVYWYGEAAAPGAIRNIDAMPSFRVTANNAYTVDSVAFSFMYRRRDAAHVDTLYIQYIKVNAGSNPFGIYDLQFTGGGDRFVSAMYDPNTNKLSDSIAAANVMTQQFILDQAFWADSTANGYSMRMAAGIAPPSALSLTAGQKLLIYSTVRFSGGYTLGTNEDLANTARFIGYDISGMDLEPAQSRNSRSAGLVATKQSKYTPPYNGFTVDGHNILIPSVAYATDGFYSNYAFKLSCATCPELSVKDTKANILNINAFPNPAQTQVTVPFSLNTTADVKVTLTNVMGQVVSTKNVSNVLSGNVVFSTSELANGVYFYTVSANGESKSGRVVVSH